MINFEANSIYIKMIGNLLKKLFGDKNAKDQKHYEPFSIAANEFQLSLKSISDDELRGKTFAFQQLIFKFYLNLSLSYASNYFNYRFRFSIYAIDCT